MEYEGGWFGRFVNWFLAAGEDVHVVVKIGARDQMWDQIWVVPVRRCVGKDFFECSFSS